MDALQMMPCGTLLRNRLSATDSSVIRAQHQTAGAKAGLRGRVLAAQEVASPPCLAGDCSAIAKKDQDPPPRQRGRLAHEDGDHTGADIRSPRGRSGHDQQPARAKRPVGRQIL